MRAILLFTLIAISGAARAQELKALSAQEIEQYRAGAGMGFAKAAELNRFPGPMHVLEHADALGLTAEQRTATKALMEEHKARARTIGAELVTSEAALDALFRSGAVDATELAAAVRRVAAVQGEYRLSHLETHRRMRDLLTHHQIVQYDRLRGNSPHKH